MKWLILFCTVQLVIPTLESNFKFLCQVAPEKTLTEKRFTNIQTKREYAKKNQLNVMCTTRDERSSIDMRCQKECVESKLVISRRMMHNLIKIYHVG